MLTKCSKSLFMDAVVVIMNKVHGQAMTNEDTRGAAITIEDGLKLNPVAVSDKHPLPRPERQHWLELTSHDVKQAFTAKYQAGQAGHGCDLGTVTLVGLLDEMESEALDQLAYVHELKRRLM